MLTVRLQGVHLNRSFTVWSTEERKPQRLSLASSVLFEKCTVPGIISVGVLNAQGMSVGTGHIEFCACVSGENRVVARTRKGKAVCSLTLFVERQGFITDSKFDLDTLKDQCSVLAERYAPFSPIVTTAFGFDVPAAFFTRYVRRPTANETDFRDGLVDIIRARYGTSCQITPQMYAEAMGTMLHFCLPAEQNIRDEDLVEAIYSMLYVPSAQMQGVDCDVTMVHLQKHDGKEAVAVALYDNVSHKNYLVDTGLVSPVPVREDIECPNGVTAFQDPKKAYDKVLFQYGAHGMRKVGVGVEKWILGAWNNTEFKTFLEMDTMVLDTANKLYAVSEEISGKVLKIESHGSTSGTFAKRFCKKGLGRILSGCRTVMVSAEVFGQTQDWTEYIVYE